jgi:hypothetical protein
LAAAAVSEGIVAVDGRQPRRDATLTTGGALYDELRRRSKVLAGPDAKTRAKIVKHEDWNGYVIRCEGPRIRRWLNGTLTVDYTEKDDKIARTGVIGLQFHGGAKAKVY